MKKREDCRRKVKEKTVKERGEQGKGDARRKIKGKGCCRRRKEDGESEDSRIKVEEKAVGE
jgi:hypothetical protein